MQIYQGKPVFEGVAIGKIRIHKQEGQTIAFVKVEDIHKELERFGYARVEALKKLREWYHHSLDKIGKANATIFEAQEIFLSDENYVGDIENLINTLSCNAEYAIGAVQEKYRFLFEQTDDDYMKARISDLKDVSERLLEALRGDALEEETFLEPVIILAEDILPSELMRMEQEMVLALVLTKGSFYSHTAILARTMGIPTLIQVNLNVDADMDEQIAVADSESGVFIIQPDQSVTAQVKQRLQQAKCEESADDQPVGMRICANIGSLKDLESLDGKPVDGIGLMRSEFVFFEREDFPSEDEQFEIYRTVLQAMPEKKVVIRVLDIGADKQCAYLPMEKEENPALGMRGVRVLLENQQILRTQLRALLRASVYGELHILYPMVTGLEEVHSIKEILISLEKELQEQGIVYGHPKQGVMIETPAAVIISDMLAEEVDFFSVGTNDLTQYTLAMDRQSPWLADIYQPRHPAVLRMIRLVVENAHKKGIEVAICGELSADTTLTKEFVQMGVDELSVAPGYVSSVRRKCKECRK
ncbi:MAG: phosphoenolpyruvate--protein phosphotransferase [Lachnospiraceae bacterium]|nr:phosphoenolpyruvate--protein phosphotransferase [Lachnospiraceae bacterium]